MKRKLFLLATVLSTVFLIAGCATGGNPDPLAPPPAPTYTPYPVQPTLTPYPTQPAPPAATATNAPAPTQPPPAPTTASSTTSCLSIAQFKAMWTASTPAQGPGPLILELNKVWDANGINRDLSAIGNGWLSGPYTVQPMSLVWTDLLGQQPTVPPGQGKWVPLRTQGGWGVFAVYDRVVVPTPGRSARMCESLNPEAHLAGWK